MAYIMGNREQRVLLPSCIDEYITPDDPVRAYDAVVEQMDLAALGIMADPDRVGAPAFDPRAMLKLLVYGYSYGIRSSRQLERATHHNLSFIWLLGGLTPDHKTIARFRRDHRTALAHVLKQCAQVCVRLGVIAGNTLFVDGTKIRANASMKQTWTAKRCQDMLQDVEHRYRQPDARAMMRRRKLRAEPPVGHIKHNLGMRMFVLRGQRGAAAEMALAATAFNIRRLVTLVGVAGLVQHLRHASP